MAPKGYGNPLDSNPPTGLNWDLFLFHYRWFWDYSGDWMTDCGAHHMDVVHWGMDVKGPTAASAGAGQFCCDDNTETPDTLTTVFEYPGFIARYSLSHGQQP